MKRLIIIVVAALLAVCVLGCSSGGTTTSSAGKTSQSSNATSPVSSSASLKNSYGMTNPTADTVFGYPESVSVRGGTVGVFRASSDDCTIENITTWCNQYVRHELDDWCVILYTDKPGYGVYAGAGMVEVDTEIDNNYMTAGSDTSTMYVFKAPSVIEDGELSLVG